MQHRPGGLGGELPGDDVRVVLHLGEKDLVPLPEDPPTPRVGHQVDRFGGAAVEHHTGGLGGSDERGQLSRAPSNIAVASSPSVSTPRCALALCRRSSPPPRRSPAGLLPVAAAVQIDQGAPVDRSGEDGEVRRIRSMSSGRALGDRHVVLLLRRFLRAPPARSSPELLPEALVPLHLDPSRAPALRTARYARL